MFQLEVHRALVLAALLLPLLALAGTSEAGNPTWTIQVDRSAQSAAITVNASQLANNEYVSQADCQVEYLDGNGTAIGTRTHKIAVPIQAGESQEKEFRFEIPSAATVRGVAMNWEVVVIGVAAYQSTNATRRGTSPPS